MSSSKFPIDTRAVVNFAEGYMLLTPEALAPGRARLPNYDDTIVHTLAFPMYWADFHEYLMEMGKNGRTAQPIRGEYEYFVYVLEGEATLTANDNFYEMSGGSYAYLPPGTVHSVDRVSLAPFKFLVIKRSYLPAGPERPRLVHGNEKDVPQETVPGERRSRKCLIPYEDILYDMAVNILSFEPGAGISIETHAQHHGIYMLSGACLWYLGNKWYQSKAGDFIWLGSFAPQAAWFTGSSPGAYLLYKNWNR